MDSNNSTPPDLPLPQEGTGGHDMWPIDDEGIIIGEGVGGAAAVGADSNLGGHTVTLFFKMRGGIYSRTFNAANAYTEDTFRSQDPELCASGPNDPQEDMSETQEIDCNALGLNETPQDMSQTPELYSEEDDGPEPTNKMEDHPTPPELQFETKSKYDELTPCTIDDEILSPVITSARTGIVLIRPPRPISKFTDLLGLSLNLLIY